MPDNITSSFAATDFAPPDPFAAGATPGGEFDAFAADADTDAATDLAAPDPVAELRRQLEELAPIKSEFEKLQAERQREQLDRDHRAYQQHQQATREALFDWRKQLAEEYAMPAEQVDLFSSIAQEAVQGREKLSYYEQMAPLWGQAIKGYQTYQEVLQYLPDTATIKDLKEFAGVLGAYNDPASLRQAAKMLSELRGQARGAQSAQSRRDAVNNGAVRLEGGAQMAPAGMNAQTTWAAYGRGEIGWSDRVRAAGRSLGYV